MERAKTKTGKKESYINKGACVRFPISGKLKMIKPKQPFIAFPEEIPAMYKKQMEVVKEETLTAESK